MYYFIGLEQQLLKVTPTTHRHKRQHSSISTKIFKTRKKKQKTNQSQRLGSSMGSTLNYHYLKKWRVRMHIKMRDNSRGYMNKISHPFLVLSHSYRFRLWNLLTKWPYHFLFLLFMCIFLYSLSVLCFKTLVTVSLHSCMHNFWVRAFKALAKQCLPTKEAEVSPRRYPGNLGCRGEWKSRVWVKICEIRLNFWVLNKDIYWKKIAICTELLSCHWEFS